MVGTARAEGFATDLLGVRAALEDERRAAERGGVAMGRQTTRFGLADAAQIQNRLRLCAS